MKRFVCSVIIDFENVETEDDALDEFMSYVNSDLGRRDVQVEEVDDTKGKTE